MSRRARLRREELVRRAVAGWCLHYPDERLYAQLGLLRAALEELADPPAGLDAALTHLETTPALTAGRRYVETFDSRPRRGLYLTWFTDGDTRNRGAALSRLARHYTAAGFTPSSDELPDHLPTLLELTVRAPGRDSEELLTGFAPAIGLLRDNLVRHDPLYGGVLSDVLATVHGRPGPPPAPRPTEWVGLEGYTLTAATPSSAARAPEALPFPTVTPATAASATVAPATDGGSPR